MRAIFLMLIATCMITLTYAQDAAKDMKKASRLVGSYRLDPVGNKEKLMEAKDLIDGAVNDAEVSNESKAWQTYAEVYTEMMNAEVQVLATDQSASIQNPVTPVKAVEGYMRAYDKAQKNFQRKDALQGLSGILNNTSYIASVLLRDGDYINASNVYNSLVNGNDFLIDNGESSIYAEEKDFQEQIYWSALAAFSAERYGSAEEQFTRLHEEGYDSPDIYSAMFDIKNKQGDNAAAEEWLKMGLEKYPGDKGLMFAEINYALAQGDLAKLEDKLKAAMEAEPENISIPTTLGNVYDQLYQKALEEGNQEDADKYYELAKTYFSKALALDETYFDAVYMMGAVEYNKAAEYANIVNSLADDYSKEGTKKYEAAKEDMLVQFDKALPYFLKAEELNAQDRNTLIALREIYARKDMLEKSNEYKEKLESLPVND